MSNAELIDETLAARRAQSRAAEITAEYSAASGEQTLDEPDDWGDLESFRKEAAQ